MVISTGIEMLDVSLKGGIKEGSSLLILSTPGVEEIQFAHQCLFTHLEAGGSVVYLVNNKKPAIVREMLKEYDWNISGYEKKGRCMFLDCYSGLMSMGSRDSRNIKIPTDLKEVMSSIMESVTGLNSQVMIVFDSLSSLIDVTNSEEDAIQFVKSLKEELAAKKVTLVALFTHWPYEDTTIHEIRELFDCVINLKAIEQKVILRSYFSVDKAGWLPGLGRNEMPYKVISPGGVKVFIPKILVTGPFHAGKTSFIHSVSTKAVSVQRLGTTVALDHGHVEYRGFSVDLFGTPGQERFDPILKILGGEALGVIVVIDSTDPSGFARAKDMVAKTKTEGLPLVVVANKANLNGAMRPEEVRENMHIPAEIPIISVVAENLNDVQAGKPCRLFMGDVEKVLSRLFEKVV